MLAVQQQVSMEHNSRLVGQTVEVMVEGESKLISRQKRSANNVQLGWDRTTAVAEVTTTQLWPDSRRPGRLFSTVRLPSKARFFR